jgi:hypothetical protein
MSSERDLIAGLLFVINWLGDYVADPDSHESHVEYLVHQKWFKEFFPYKDSEHFGDCTKACQTCLRCETDELYKQADELIKKYCSGV